MDDVEWTWDFLLAEFIVCSTRERSVTYFRSHLSRKHSAIVFAEPLKFSRDRRNRHSEAGGVVAVRACCVGALSCGELDHLRLYKQLAAQPLPSPFDPTLS
jgi:hypothetical protein